MKAQKIIALAVAVIVIGGASFYAGTLLAHGNKSGNRNMPGFTNGIDARGAKGNDNFVNGQILSIDSSSITVKIPNNGSKIILLTDSTPISKMASGTKADLTVGETIMATGTTNTDGSVTAQSIQIRPSMPNPGAPTNSTNPAPADTQK
ncbi:MAG: DUF5666 domain-containing protein [Patescibacteria group bacterium]|nr:DUF5666 domain-containing protein [Patescibacteria group bacterium]